VRACPRFEKKKTSTALAQLFARRASALPLPLSLPHSLPGGIFWRQAAAGPAAGSGPPAAAPPGAGPGGPTPTPPTPRADASAGGAAGSLRAADDICTRVWGVCVCVCVCMLVAFPVGRVGSSACAWAGVLAQESRGSVTLHPGSARRSQHVCERASQRSTGGADTLASRPGGAGLAQQASWMGRCESTGRCEGSTAGARKEKGKCMRGEKIGPASQ